MRHRWGGSFHEQACYGHICSNCGMRREFRPRMKKNGYGGTYSTVHVLDGKVVSSVKVPPCGGKEPRP